MELPCDPFHNEFRLRFRTQVSASNDEWFIDDLFVGVPSLPACPADLSGDGVVRNVDVLLVLAAWWACDEDCPEDLSGDGVVGNVDVLLVLADWGDCPR